MTHFRLIKCVMSIKMSNKNFVQLISLPRSLYQDISINFLKIFVYIVGILAIFMIGLMMLNPVNTFKPSIKPAYLKKIKMKTVHSQDVLMHDALHDFKRMGGNNNYYLVGEYGLKNSNNGFRPIIEGISWAYSAYYDARLPKHLVKIIGLLHVNHTSLRLRCQLWYGKSQKPEMANVTFYAKKTVKYLR